MAKDKLAVFHLLGLYANFKRTIYKPPYDFDDDDVIIT
jgi:hypothetical protein